MNKFFVGLLIAGMVASGICYAMDSDSESSSSCESESLPAEGLMTDDILVYIANPDVARLIRNARLSRAAGGIDAWLRKHLSYERSLEADYKFVQERKRAIALCKLLEGMQFNWSKGPIIVPMPASEKGIYIRFTATGWLRSARKLKKTLKSPYVTKIVYDYVDAAIADAQGEEPVHEVSTDELDIPAEPCMDPIRLDAQSSDFLVYIGAPQAAQYLEKTLAGNFEFAVSVIRRELCKQQKMIIAEKLLSDSSLTLQLCSVIEKMIQRFSMRCSIVEMPREEKGMYLKFHRTSPCLVDEIANTLKKSPYITRIIPNDGNAYLAKVCEGFALSRRFRHVKSVRESVEQ